MKNPIKVIIEFYNDRKRYRTILDLLDNGQYKEALNFDNYYNQQYFGINDAKLGQRILDKIDQIVVSDDNLFKTMVDVSYKRIDDYTEKVFSQRPNIIEDISKLHYTIDQTLLSTAIDHGYKPSVYLIENDPIFKYAFNNPDLMIKALNTGYSPSKEFIKSCPAFKNENVLELLLETYDSNVDDLENTFNGNIIAQSMILDKKPELINELNHYGDNFIILWIESIKNGYLPKEALKNYSLNSNFLLMSKIVAFNPEYIKCAQITDKEEKEQLDKLAVAMGYVPSKDEVMQSEYVQKSFSLMETAIKKRPELIKYAIKTEFGSNFSDEQFNDLAKQAINCGYIPSENDLSKNPRLRSNFDIMMSLIEKSPIYIEKCDEKISNVEVLAQRALSNGYVPTYLLIPEIEKTEAFVKQRFILNNKLPIEGFSHNNYSIDLYNYLVQSGCSVNEIGHLFYGNYATMKLIINESPSLIKNANYKYMNRQQIDDLCMSAIESGYIPTENDIIFGHGLESIKFMVQRYTNFLDEVKLFDDSLINATPILEYEEICQLALNAGYEVNPRYIGKGSSFRYTYSYSIMKKAIEMDESRIEDCLVKNKELFDELCKLAISKGYIPTEYAITHSRINSSYDIMEIAVKQNPLLVLESKISDNNDLEKLINIAVQSGFEIDRLEDDEIIKLFLPLSSEKWVKHLPQEKIIMLQESKKLFNFNDEVSNTIKPEIFSNKISEHFSVTQLEILSCYPSLQNQIVKSAYNSESLQAKLIFALSDKYRSNGLWISILEKVLNNINSPDYKSLFLNLSGKELSEYDNQKFLYLLTSDNHLNITKYSELQSIDKIRENYINEMTKRGTIGSLKTACLEKMFGLNMSNAINLVESYGGSLESQSINNLNESQKQLFSTLQDIKRILNTNNIGILKSYIENTKLLRLNYEDAIVFENKIKSIFADEFNKSFSKPKEEDRITDLMPKENGFDIFYAAGQNGDKQIKMMITSIGAYSNLSEPDNYYDAWNISKVMSHNVCCSYVGEKNMGTAEIKYCCYGFTDYDSTAILSSAPYDLCSASGEEQFSILTGHSPKFLLPNDVLDNTRHTHNETVWERRNLSNLNQVNKKQPSYIVYFVDKFEDRLTNDEAKRQWECVQKASSDFAVNGKPLPIMVVEREKIASNQLKQINSNMEQFEKTLDKSLIESVVSDYESSYAGNRGFHENITNNYFPKHNDLKFSVTGRILGCIQNACYSNKTKALDCLNEVERIILNEKEKYRNTKHGLSDSIPSFNIDESLYIINELKEKLIEKKTILGMVKSVESNDKQFLKQDAQNLSPEILNNQLALNDVQKILNENGLSSMISDVENQIKTEKINQGLKSHGERHIKNVVLFSGLIGQQVLPKEDMSLLINAAKYHDAGRNSDGHEEHSKASAKIALKRLEKTLTSEEVSIIKTAIEFHEVKRDANADDAFHDIAKSNGVKEENLERTKLISEILKDADALDRTRYINDSRLKPEYLHFTQSNRLIKFSAQLQEAYAIEDLKSFNCDEQISKLLSQHTPQYALRTIRQSLDKSMSPSDAKYFISDLAQSLLQNLHNKNKKAI